MFSEGLAAIKDCHYERDLWVCSTGFLNTRGEVAIPVSEGVALIHSGMPDVEEDMIFTVIGAIDSSGKQLFRLRKAFTRSRRL